jgi:two-component system cell cycle sensor histidine kinase/response regulator CckA
MGPADPAYRRLTVRQARRGLSAAALSSVVFTAISIVIHVLRADPEISMVWAGGPLVAFGILWFLSRRVPSRLVVPLTGVFGLTAVAGVVGSAIVGPLFAPALVVGLVGLIPIGIGAFAMWDVVAHVGWLAAGTVVIVAYVLIGRDASDLAEVASSVMAIWLIAGLFSVLSQQLLERSRFAIYDAARRAHAARASAAASLRQLRAVEAIGQALSEHGPTDATLDAAVRMLVDSFGYTHPAIYLGDDQVLRLGAQVGYDGLPPVIERGRGVVGRVMATRQPVLLAEVALDPGYVRASTDDRSEICVPLLAGERFMGVINIESAFPLGSDDLSTVRIIGDRLAAALDLAERRNTLERFLEASPVAITAFAVDGTVVYWNRAATALFGWPADEVLGRPTPVVDPDDPVSLAIDREVIGGRLVSGVDAIRRHRDGRLIPVRISAAPIGERPPYGTIGVYQDLTAERAASAAINESESRFETVVGALREGVIVQDMDLNVLWSNGAAGRLLGVSSDQLAGREPWDGRWAVVREDGTPVDRSEYPGEVAARTGLPVLGVTVGVRRLSGELAWLEADAVLLRRAADDAPYAVVTSLSDVTDRKRHEDELARAELQVRSVLEQAANPIVGVDMGGRITYANRRAGAIFGWAADELVGQPIEVLVPEGSAEAHVDLRDAFLAQPVARPMGIGLDLVARRRDGSTIPVEVSMSPVETPAGRQVFATVIDTTERRRVEAELLQAAKMDSLGRLAGGIAHDFNNLLTAILGYGEIAMAELPPDDTVRKEVGEMVKAAERASGLTRQLLGFARRSVVAPAAHDLNSIVAGLAPFLGRLLGERIALVTHLGPANGHVKVDRSQLDQMLVNLAVNARDAMPDGGTLVIETASLGREDVDAMLGVTGERIALLTVSDTGLGMTEETQAHVFEPFFTTKPFGEGTGLGLATTYGIVRGSGGAITVDSAPGAGTTFRIYLPEVEPADAEAGAEITAPAVAGPQRTILVVEDEESVRTLTTRMLERAGYHVLEAPNGAAAVSLVGTRLDEVDLLLSDIVMPGMRGPELYETLRAARGDLPAVFMSGYIAGDLGASSVPPDCPVLAKPFASEALLAAVGEALR